MDNTIFSNPIFTNLAYLLASVLFLFGLKGLTHPRTAVRGNMLGASGMLLAIVVTLLSQGMRFEIVFAGIILGGLIGLILAIKIQMTAMPQLVAVFNGFGGGASALVAGAALIEIMLGNGDPSMRFSIATVVSGIIGGVTFSGSLVAFAKLQDLISGNSMFLPAHHAISILLAILALVIAVMICMNPAAIYLYWIMVGVALIWGIVLVIPIGGADMPVVISLLNSYSGLAAAATGFVLMNNVLIIAGSLVGASGLILTSIMCKAMNRSLTNVLFGVMGPSESGAKQDDIYEGKIKSTSPEEVAMLLESARRVVFVPGYGLAVSQAQHAVRDLTNWLEQNGTEVEYGIHPVAGRMPGHMNVLLAEADIDYDKLKEMDDINPTFKQTDVTIVIGANDVVNPVANTDPNSPIAGMPILNVNESRTVVMIKRSLSPGFAGIPNPLFAADNCLMLFGDGKKALLGLISALKEG